MPSGASEVILFEVQTEGDSSGLKVVDKGLDSLEQSYRDLQQRSEVTADQLKNATVEAGRLTQQTASSAQEASRSMDTLSSSASTTANSLAIELTSAAQDAQFGMAGVANQIPFIAEEFGRLRTQTGSTTGALRSLLGTFFGPTGLLAVGTLALQALPSIIDFFQGMGEGAEDADKKVSEALNTLFDFSQADLDQIGSDIRRVNVRLSTLRDRIEELRSQQLGPGAQRARTLFPSSPLEQVETALRTLESVDARSVDALPGTAIRDVVRSVESVEAPAENAQRALRTVLGGLRDAQQRKRQITALEQKIQDLSSGLDKLVQKRKEVAREVRVQNALREAGVQSLKDEAEAATEAADQQQIQLPEADLRVGSVGFVEPPNAPEIVPPDQLGSIRTQLTLLERVRNQIRIINQKPFLKDAQKTEQRVQAVVQSIREAQQQGRLLSRTALKGFLQDLDLTEKEVQRVKAALRGVEKQGQQSAEAFLSGFSQAVSTIASQIDDKLTATIIRLIGQIAVLAASVATGGAAGAAGGGGGQFISLITGLAGSFAEGGYTGDRPADSVAGVVHGGEYVMSAPAVDGQVQEMHAVHELMKSGVSLGRIFEMAGLPGYKGGGFVDATTPVTSVGGGSSSGGAEGADARRVAEETARRVAEEVANRPVVVQIGPRTARDIQRQAEEYEQRTNPEA
jgi:hypothetical protein